MPSPPEAAEAPEAAVAEARAWALRSGAAREYDRLCARADTASTARLGEVLLGLRGIAAVTVPAGDADLGRVLDALRYRTAAYVAAYDRPAGGAFVVSVGRLLADLAAHSVAPPPGFPDPRALPADLVAALLARPPRPPRPPRARGPARSGRRRIGPEPTLVFSTAGAPAALDAALRGYLTEFGRAGHDDLRVLVVDDARPGDSARVGDIVAAVGRDTGARLTRFAEWRPDGSPGPKAEFRAAVAKGIGSDPGCSDLAGDVARLLAPDAAGSANAAFLLLAGRPVVWLEQDARPYAVHGAGPAAGPAPTGVRMVEHAHEVAGPTPPGSEPVDVLHVVDRLLYGGPEYPGYPDEHPTWEDAGHEAVSGAPAGSAPAGSAPAWGVPPRLVHFHVAGHPDYRARFSHNALTLARHAAPARAALASGGLDRTRLMTAPPEPAIVGRGASAFGTVVGFHHDLPLAAPMMAATRIRIIDFTVGLLLRAAGPCAAAWAATALTHVREEVTTSGRGRLAPYLALEELLWPLYHAMERLLGDLPRDAGEDAPAWLDRAGRHIERAAATWQPPATTARRLWRDHLCDRAIAAGAPPADVAAHLAAVAAQGAAGPVAAGRAAGDRLRAELRAYGRQLRIWAALTPDRLAALRAPMLRGEGALPPSRSPEPTGYGV